MTPKKSLGQNFLRDPKILKKIADFAEIKTTDTVLEVGPGEGGLTKILLEQAKKVIAIEKDRELVKALQEKFSQEVKNKKLEIIEGDVLDLQNSSENEPCERDGASTRNFSAEKYPCERTEAILQSQNYKLVGNIPYYITGALFKKFLSAQGGFHQPKSITFVVQREVAERILAKKYLPAGRQEKESILSISIKAYGKPEFGGIIKAGSFFPAPKVDSAIISVRNINKENFLNLSEQLFFEILKNGFAHKRKFLIKNLENLFDKEKLQKAFGVCHLEDKIRSEDLRIEDWIRLSKNLS